MLEIKSKDNSKIKALLKLNKKSERDISGLFIVENEKIIADAGQEAEQLFIVDKKRARMPRVKEIFLISKEINKKISSLDTASGIVAVYKKPKSQIDYKDRIVYLNGVADPGNVGAIMRSAVAFGYKNIILDEECADAFSAKTISSAKDAIFKLNIGYDKNKEQLKKIKQIMKIYATRPQNGVAPEILKGKKLFCLVFGSEGQGIDAQATKLADNFIKIPMSGKVDSLNVAISAGICLYTLVK